MERRRELGLVAGLLLVLVAGAVTSVLVGFAGPVSEHRPPAAVTAATGPVGDQPAARPSASAEPRTRDAERRYSGVTRTAAQLGGGAADLYLPLAGSAGEAPRRFPIVVLVADPRTDPGQYEQLAHDLGTYGLAVVVTDREAGAAVRAVRRWAAGVRSDPTDYLSDKLSGSVSFVVHTGAARPASSVPSSVRAQVQVAPTVAVARPLSSSVPTLIVCAGGPVAADACDASDPSLARVVVPRSDASSVTDEGRRGARISTVVDPDRLQLILAFARPTALWLLAHNGDAHAREAVRALRTRR